MGDLLSAASLLLTVLTVLYSLWLPEITAASNSVVDPHPENRTEAYRASRSVFLSKALMLCLAAFALIATMTPPAIAIMYRPMYHPFADKLDSYDAVATIFVVVFAVLILLTLHTVAATWTLRNHVQKLDPERR